MERKMSCGSVKHKVKGAFDKVVEWDKKLIKKMPRQIWMDRLSSSCHLIC